MASYYDEHNCQPLADGEQPNHALHLARILIDGGYAREWEMEFQGLFADKKVAPPASVAVVAALPRLTAADTTEKRHRCPICIVPYERDDTLIVMPCKHEFHSDCILPWLKKTNSCPVCRHELPTDDPDYEEYKKQKARTKQREFEIQSLHDSMFG